LSDGTNEGAAALVQDAKDLIARLPAKEAGEIRALRKVCTRGRGSGSEHRDLLNQSGLVQSLRYMWHLAARMVHLPRCGHTMPAASAIAAAGR
jgi:hypothetical protein